jgi:hypothetical protein
MSVCMRDDAMALLYVLCDSSSTQFDIKSCARFVLALKNAGRALCRLLDAGRRAGGGGCTQSQERTVQYRTVGHDVRLLDDARTSVCRLRLERVLEAESLFAAESHPRLTGLPSASWTLA